jgi:hypothetical protein
MRVRKRSEGSFSRRLAESLRRHPLPGAELKMPEKAPHLQVCFRGTAPTGRENGRRCVSAHPDRRAALPAPRRSAPSRLWEANTCRATPGRSKARTEAAGWHLPQVFRWFTAYGQKPKCGTRIFQNSYGFVWRGITLKTKGRCLHTGLFHFKPTVHFAAALCRWRANSKGNAPIAKPPRPTAKVILSKVGIE